MRLATTLLGALLPVLLSGCAIWSSGLDCGSPPDFATARTAFNEAHPRHDDFEDERRRFAAHALDCASLDGLPKREVQRLLGSPREPGGRDWSYYLGYDSIGGDDDRMGIHFDREGRVDQVSVS